MSTIAATAAFENARWNSILSVSDGWRTAPVLLLCMLLLTPLPTTAADQNAESESRATQEVDFEADIWPILEANCQDCHAGELAEARLRLDAREGLRAGGVSGPFTPQTLPSGAPSLTQPLTDDELQRHRFWERLITADEDLRMPLDGDPLSQEELELLRRWLAAGAPWPDGIGESLQVEKHWAYETPQRAPLPTVADPQWPRNAIDHFVLAKLEAKGWQPSAEAAPRTLVRRLYLDLIGIPPSPAEVDRFLADPRADRYERLVDRLLASPRYGERWAQPWLDAARYADSNGYQADQLRETWAYRDWVIRALNQDMPFDQFTIEQLAGDLLDEPTQEQLIATGFHRLTTCNVEAGVDPEENRVNQVIDRVNTTATVWLGTTLECAQCHNHKYDPFSQRDYYALFAYFNQTPLEVEDSGNNIRFDFVGPKMELPLPSDQQRRREKLQRRLDEYEQRAQTVVAEADRGFSSWLSQLEAELAQPANWEPLELDRFVSSGGATSQELEDGSLLISGKRPDQDHYRLVLQADRPVTIRALRLETLTDPSLPGNGPGRHSQARPNFVLREVHAAVVGEEVKFDEPLLQVDSVIDQAAVKWRAVFADFSQENWHVDGLIDGEPATGWGINPQFGQPHWAVLVPEQPIQLAGGERLVLRMDQQHGGTRTIGRFRWSFGSELRNTLQLPEAIEKLVRATAEERDKAQIAELKSFYREQRPELRELEKQRQQLQQQLHAINPPTTLVMVEESPRETHIFKRGEFLSPGEQVSAGTPRVLPELPAEAPANRLGLARWLVSPENPLTPRVIVNRWWAAFFGRGLVATLEDFGTQGEPPTHPELLDWLAQEFVAQGWSRKAMHRLLVTSATYRQRSQMTTEQLARDPGNRWYGRAARFRLPAETIRDNALTISGQLSPMMFGEPVYPPQPGGVWRHVGRNAPQYKAATDEARYRRGIYVVWRRSAPYPSFVNFDAPDRASCRVERPRTNTPLQALTLLNDPAYVELAEAFAERIMRRNEEGSPVELVQDAFRCCVSREPDAGELAMLVEMYMREYQLALEASGRNQEVARQAAVQHLATVLLNLDETISRE